VLHQQKSVLYLCSSLLLLTPNKLPRVTPLASLSPGAPLPEEKELPKKSQMFLSPGPCLCHQMAHAMGTCHLMSENKE